MFNLLHCIPTVPDRLRGISTYKELLADDGVLIGCTVLGEKHSLTWLTTLHLRLYNWLRVFFNSADTKDRIEDVLREEFEQVECRVVGMVLLFKAEKPRRSK
jgi:hypothetical protein